MTDQRINASPSVLITGSSSGIGEACAIEFHRRGFQVFAGVRREVDGQRLIEQTSSRLAPVLLDVTDSESIAEAAKTIAQATGDSGLTGLVNNAGITVAFPLEFLPIDELRRQLEVNVIGPVAVTQAMLPLLRTAQGRVVNVSSISGRLAAPYIGAYAASKHALEALSDSLRIELRNFGVKVSVVQPGDVDTPIWQKSRESADRLRDRMLEDAAESSVSQEVRDNYAADIQAMRATTSKFAEKAMPVERVVRAVVHAVCARRPKTRYPLGAKTRGALAMRFVPDRIRDWVVCRSLGMK